MVVVMMVVGHCFGVLMCGLEFEDLERKGASLKKLEAGLHGGVNLW
jgi:hypothetical protein